MQRFVLFAFLTGSIVPTTTCTPTSMEAPRHQIGLERAFQGTSTMTITKTVVSTKFSTVTMCPTGSITTQPLSTTTNTQLTTSQSASSPTTTATAATVQPTFDGCMYTVPEAGKFKNKKEFTFFQNGLPNGLYASDYTVYDTYNGLPYNHKFETPNVYSDGEFLNLRVQGTTDPGSLQDQAISCGEIVTTENNILYASVRTNAIFSDVPGTCHGKLQTENVDRHMLISVGIFFYLDDTQECDIEYLTDPRSQANNIYASSSNGAPIPLWYSNQAVRSGQKPTNGVGPAPWDVTAVHEYRIDWTKDFTAFYLDGVLQKKYTTNVPTKPGSWIWNNWANGDPNWSMGPPNQDNIMKIQNITMYYNTTEDKSC